MPGAGLPLWSWLLLSLIGFAVTALLLVALWRVARALREQAERQRRP
jgi:multisubunit Na+/H+ antiporter MnhC subunit